MLFILLLALLVPQGLVKETLPGAKNVTRVDAVVMCGGATTPSAIPELRKRGFASIVNLRLEEEPGADIAASKAAAEAAGLKYIHIPIGVNPDPAAAGAFIKAVTTPANQPVYIHCASANRVGAMWLVKRVVVDGWEIPRALEEAEAIGLTHEGLKKWALEYAAAHGK